MEDSIILPMIMYRQMMFLTCPYFQPLRILKKYLKNENISIAEYLKNYLTLNGANFEENMFGNYAPGAKYTYSNIGSTLAAYIIELVSGQSFKDFTKAHIFDPIGMKNSIWNQSNSQNCSNQYFHNGCKAPDYSLIPFPSSGLHTNSHDMGIFMTEMMKGYNGHGNLLNKSSYAQMFTNQINTEGIKDARGVFWEIKPDGNIGHGGAEIGISCEVIFSPKLQKSFFMMINYECI